MRREKSRRPASGGRRLRVVLPCRRPRRKNPKSSPRSRRGPRPTRRATRQNREATGGCGPPPDGQRRSADDARSPPTKASTAAARSSSACPLFRSVLAQKESGQKPLQRGDGLQANRAYISRLIEKYLARTLLSSYPKGGDSVGGPINAAGGIPAGMKRVIVLALCLVGLIAVAIAAIPFLVSTDLAKHRIADEIARWTGRSVSFSGEPEVSFFPHINVELRGVTLANPENMKGDPFIALDAVIGRIRILPLFLGRTEVAEFRLVNPRLSLKVDAEGRANWKVGPGGPPSDRADRKASEVAA